MKVPAYMTELNLMKKLEKMIQEECQGVLCGFSMKCSECALNSVDNLYLFLKERENDSSE